MFKRKRRLKKDPLDYVSLPKLDLDPDTKKGIFIVLILAFGLISLLGLFDLAGAVGTYLAKALLALFGWSRWLVPIILLIWGVVLYNDSKYYIRKVTYFGLFILIISFQTILHYFLNHSEWKEMIQFGTGGGYLGYFFALMFYKFFGFWGGVISAICLFFISLMLTFNTTLAQLVGSESWFAKLLYHPIKFIFGKIFSRANEDNNEAEIGADIYEEDNSDGEEEANEEMENSFNKKKIKTGDALNEVYFDESHSAKAAEGKTPSVEEEKLWKKSNIKIDLPLDLLSGRIGKPTSGDIKANTETIKKTLEHFGIPVEMGETNIGPTVTQYTFKPAEGVKLSRITNLGNDLALSLAAHPIRIEAPIPGKSLVGVEVPNQAKAIVGLREILSAKDFKDRKSNLMLGLGKDVSGAAWLYDLSKMPHLLVAGATNSGKSVCLNSVIVGLLYQNNPDDLKFIMVDPKRVELPVYNGIPHLLVPVITDVKKTINALRWCLNEMDRRFEELSKTGKRNIASYNAGINGSKKGKEEKMPYIVFIIDELADLMVAAGRDIEGAVIRLAQMSRAVGIHLILATQRPSVDVITGLIKANMPARIAFAVASGVDSRTILDSLGAEKLLGRGDMLFVTAELSKPKRLQGAFVSDDEIRKIVNYITEKGGDPDYVFEITEKQKVKGIGGAGLAGGGEIDDDLIGEAKDLIINSGKASTTYLQRKLGIGYARAAKLIDGLEELGVVGPGNGSKPREILISREQYANIISQGVSGVSIHSREESRAPEEYLGSSFAEASEDKDGDIDNNNEIDSEDEIIEEIEVEKKNGDGLPTHAKIDKKKPSYANATEDKPSINKAKFTARSFSEGQEDKKKKDFEFEDKLFSR